VSVGPRFSLAMFPTYPDTVALEGTHLGCLRRAEPVAQPATEEARVGASCFRGEEKEVPLGQGQLRLARRGREK
jgi:hypothetical protein